MPDLENVIKAMQDSQGWFNNIFKMEDPAKVKSACIDNKMIAMHTLSKVFLASGQVCGNKSAREPA